MPSNILELLDGIDSLDSVRREDRMILVIKLLCGKIDSFEHTLRWMIGAFFVAGLGLMSTLVAHYVIG